MAHRPMIVSVAKRKFFNQSFFALFSIALLNSVQHADNQMVAGGGEVKSGKFTIRCTSLKMRAS